MFRSKREVDRHVQEILSKVKTEAERNLRFYNVAKLFYGVGDLESTQQYVRCYLSVRPDVAGAHKLLAQALEGLKQKEKALEEYKCSLKLESRQPDVVLKVCDLIVDLKIKLDAGEARYWRERAEEEKGNHPTVYKFKEYLIRMEGGSGDHAELEQLIKQEVDARPLDVAPKIKLLRLYLDSHRSAEAFMYAGQVESTLPFRDDVQWYSCVVDVYKAIYSENSSKLGWDFFVKYLCVLDRYVLLSQREQPGRRCLGQFDPLFEFDQVLYKADQFSRNTEDPLLQECIGHMSGQLCIHLAVALLSTGKQSRIGWKEYTPSAFAILSLAWQARVTDPLIWAPKENEKQYRLLYVWQRDGAFRCSQAGHVLLSLPQLQKRLSELCKQGWRQKVYEKVFASAQSQMTSYFIQHEQFSDVSLSSFGAPSTNRVLEFDLLSQHHQPDSLHYFVWLGLRYLERNFKKTSSHSHGYALPYSISENFVCDVFEKLKLITSDPKSCGVETLCKLDVDSFLYASVFCAAAAQDDLQNRGLVSDDRPAVLPVDLTEPLCTVNQGKWWSAVYRLHTNSAGKDLGGIRMIVQRGLEVVRLMGNHGMDVKLVVQLAKLFSGKAALSSDGGHQKDSQALNDWARMYWNHALTLLEKMEKNQTIRLPEQKMFSYISSDLTNNEIKTLLEEGRFFIACCFMKDEQYEKAIDIFQNLRSPYASFHQGVIYKKLADAEIEPVNEEITSDMKSNHIILLRESRAAFYLTLDRLRAPHVDSNHPLNVELVEHLQEVEDRLSRLDPETSSINNKNARSTMPDNTYFSNQSEDLRNASRIANASLHQTLSSITGITNGHVNRGWTSTPVKKGLDLDSSLISDNLSRMEARPSPERLDAQLRRMTVNNDSLIQTLTEQNRQILESNKKIVQAMEKSRLAVEDLKRQVEELGSEVGRLKISRNQPQSGKNVGYGNLFSNGEDYSEDLDLASSQLGPLSTFSYANTSYDLRTRSIVPPTALSSSQILPQGFYPQSQVPMYQPPLSSYYGLNYADTQASCIPNAYSSALPGTSGPLPSALPPSIPGVPTAISRGISGSMPVPSMHGTPVTSSPAAHGAASHLIGAPIVAPSPLTSTPSQAPRSQPLPVNVVITSSDVVPTQAPAQQPTLSVMIPPQHRHASVLASQSKSVPISTTMVSTSDAKCVPHNFQISMPPQANIPTSESLEKSLSPMKPITPQTLLTDIPTPIHSAIAVSSSKKSDLKVSNRSTDSACGDDLVPEDTDYNPCPDFKPVIPLPEEIEVITGEEDEIPLFECRAKLFKFVDHVWKERGVGPIKILKNKESAKLRILMRREQVHKICANHFITPDLELTPQSGCDRAWTWVAYDFADQQVQVEKLCVRFKTVQDATSFKEAFDKARELSKLSSSVEKDDGQCKSSPKLIANPKLNVSSNNETSRKVEVGGFSFTSTPILEPTTQDQVVSKEEKHASPQKPSPFVGFTFSAPANKGDTSSTQQKPSSFTGFSFSSPSTVFGKPAQSKDQAYTESAPGMTEAQAAWTSAVSKPKPQVNKSLFGSSVSSVPASESKESVSSGGFMFGGSAGAVDFATLASQNKGKEVGQVDPHFKGFEGAGSRVFETISKDNASEKENSVVKLGKAQAADSSTTPSKNATEGAGEDEFEPTAVFSPVVPLPNLVETLTGEEDEEVIFEERAKLLRFDSEAHEWKDRGVGKIKVLQNKAAGKVRLVMRREQVLKVCCNHYITKEMEFKPLITSDKALSWSAKDFSEGEMRLEVFAMRFKSPELMFKFKQVVEDVQKTLDSRPQVAEKAQNPQTKSLAELFKPKEGSWECSGCLTRNDASVTSCPCCQTPKPGCETQSKSEAKAPSSTFTFGILPNDNKPSGDSSPPVTGFKFSNLTTSNSKQPSLAEMFKPKAGSWECQACYTRNDAEKVSCIACTLPQPGKEDDSKATSSPFSFGTGSNPNATYTFGIPSTNDKPALESKPFCFGPSLSSTKPDETPTFVFGSGGATQSGASKGFHFNPSTDSTPTKQGFMFGTVSTSLDQTFGSPHKFDFKIKEKSPMKSPGCPSGTEDSDEAVEEDNGDDIYFQPIIPLPDKVPVHTGEEDETQLYSQRAKLFRLVDKEWKERGLGDIKILRHNITQKVRLLMRREQVLKLCLNHFISSDLELLQKDEKTWMWGAQDFSEGVVTTEKFACRFKNADIAAEFKTAVDDAKTMLVPSPSPNKKESFNRGIAVSNPEGVSVPSAINTFTFKLPENPLKAGVARNLFGSTGEQHSNSDEIEVVYEAEVTAEERAAALKLKLPQNFYLYKNAPRCTGCSGCEEDSDPDQAVAKANTEPSNNAAVSKVPSVSTSIGTNSLFSQSSFSISSPSASIFGGSGISNQSQLGGLSFNFGKSLFGTPNSPGVVSTNFGSTASNPSTCLQKEVDGATNIPFLPVNESLSFSSLAAGSTSNSAFKTDPSKSFSFAGAGSKVFGGASEPSASTKNSGGDQGGESSGGEEAGDEIETHDPHYEPIISLPDMVEVRTGEEDEEKLFCQRAKLFRYDSSTKEWKERGVGEMKILKHPGNGTFRLLLRREQVHKVVLNQRIDGSIELKPLSSSDKAWCWGGMNYAEEGGAVEELAVRFKTPEQAQDFASVLEMCQQSLHQVTSSQTHVDPVEEDPEEDDDDEEEYSDDDDDEQVLFEDKVALSLILDSTVNVVSLGYGDLRLTQCSSADGLHSFWVEVVDDAERILCRMPILGDSEVKKEGNKCIWKGEDLSEDDHMFEKTFIAEFDSDGVAGEFQDMFYKLGVEAVEQTYTHVKVNED